MDFQTRLSRAVERGHQTRDARLREELAKSLSEEELKTMHSQARLELTEHIEACLKTLADQFPGFEYHSILNEGGWGGRVNRDDVSLKAGGSSDTPSGVRRQEATLYSRLDIIVPPFSDAQIIEIIGKGTIRNKEAFHRTNFQRLNQIDVDSFCDLIDLWVLEYAERFSATT